MSSLYPSSTELLHQYSIVSIAFRHSVSESEKDFHLDTWIQTIQTYHWRPHDFLMGTGKRSGAVKYSSFTPHKIFNPNSQEMTFGFRETAVACDKNTTKTVIEGQLNHKKNVSGPKSTYYSDNFY